MERQELLNFLNGTSDSKLVTRKWNIVIDQSNANYDVGNEIIYNTEVLKSNLCCCINVYILVTGDISITKSNIATEVAFKNVHHPLRVSQRFME